MDDRSWQKNQNFQNRDARPAAVEPFGLEFSHINPPGEPVLRNVAGVSLRRAGQLYEVDAGDGRYAKGEEVVVDTGRGVTLGTVVVASERKFTTGGAELRILRRVDESDRKQQERNRLKEEESFRFCLQKIHEHQLPMKLIRTELLHSANKAVFYFSAEGRIDFRQLVKDLAYKFHLRIEMRQIGVRDETKLVGGVGACGRELCCSTWLKDFVPVSLRMAKDQNLALNPQKVSGVCGKLMCCLAYEDHTYREYRKLLPRQGALVKTPKGEGRVYELDVLRLRVHVSFEEFRDTFSLNDIQILEDGPEEGARFDEEHAQRPRDDRRERGRRMLERRGIVGSGEGAAAEAARTNRKRES